MTFISDEKWLRLDEKWLRLDEKWLRLDENDQIRWKILN